MNSINPHALLVVEPNVNGSPEPTDWLLAKQGKGLPKGCEMPVSNLLLLPLPDSLPFLGSLVVSLKRAEIPYVISYFNDKPIFIKGP